MSYLTAYTTCFKLWKYAILSSFRIQIRALELYSSTLGHDSGKKSIVYWLFKVSYTNSCSMFKLSHPFPSKCQHINILAQTNTPPKKMCWYLNAPLWKDLAWVSARGAESYISWTRGRSACKLHRYHLLLPLYNFGRLLPSSANCQLFPDRQWHRQDKHHPTHWENLAWPSWVLLCLTNVNKCK